MKTRGQRRSNFFQDKSVNTSNAYLNFWSTRIEQCVNDGSDQIDLGIGEQTCGLALPMELLIGSSVGAGEWKSPENPFSQYLF